MAQVNFRIDDDTKRRADKLFADLGMTMSGAITIFIKQSLNYQGLPFAVQKRDSSTRPMSELLQRIDDMENGRNCHYHDLLEEDDDAAKPRAKSRRTSAARRRRVVA